MKKLCVFLLLLLTSIPLFAQEASKRTGLNCGTVETEDFLSKQFGVTTYSFTSVEQRVLKVQFHIIRQTNGTGGLTTSQVDQVLTTLRNGLTPASICIVEKGRSYIDNSTYYTGGS